MAAACSAAKVELVRELGASTVIDYNIDNPFHSGEGTYEVVLNLVRGAALGPLRALLRPQGVLVTLTGIPPQIPITAIRNVVSSRRTKVMFVKNPGATLEGLSSLIENGSVRPIVERTYHWSELAEAHRRIESGRVIGKLAVVAPE